LQSRKCDQRVGAVLAAVNHGPTFLAVRAERELQRLLAGDCTLPVGVRCIIEGDRLRMRAILFEAEGEAPRIGEASGDAISPEAVAADVFGQFMG
jgi:hydroxymethylbilane synthase